MSKLDRLNARVAKLLTVAVHEVLEVVKETVSEYQEKTARTQRENESLKRRLQELQDKMKDSSASLASAAVSGGRAAVDELPDQTWSPAGPTVKPDLTQEHSLTLTLALEHADSCSFTLGGPDPPPAPPEEAASYRTPHAVKSDVDTDSGAPTTPNDRQRQQRPASVGTSPLDHARLGHARLGHARLGHARLGFNLTVVKTEPEASECTLAAAAPTEPPGAPPPEASSYDCVDLSCNSTRQDDHDDAAPKSQAASAAGAPTTEAAPYGLVLLHSAHAGHAAAPRRFGFAKNSRAALDVRKLRQQHFRRDEPHICFVCGKTFSRVGNLRIHQRCHTGEKPYGCLQCGRSFRQAGDLKKHKRVHTGEKPYYCSQCGKSFSRGENLKRHQKIHIGETLQLQQVWRETQAN